MPLEAGMAKRPKDRGACEWLHCAARATETVNQRRYCAEHAERVRRVLSTVFVPKKETSN